MELWLARDLPALTPRWVTAATSTRYRNRLRLRVDAFGQVGFFTTNKALDCAVVDPSVLDGMMILMSAATKRFGALAGFSHAEVRARDSKGRGAVVLYGHEPAVSLRKQATKIFDELDATGWCIATSTIGAPGILPHQTWLVHKQVFLRVPLDAFMQANWPVNRTLVAHVVEGLCERSTSDFADFYMGAGNFALPLLARGLRGVGVESHAVSTRAAEQAATLQGLRFDDVRAGDSTSVAEAWLANGRSFDAVIVDPPRAGLGTRARTFAQLARRTLVACSCNPNTLTVDVERIQESGFTVSSVTLFDMFPHTDHLEAVVWLERS